MGVRPLGAHDLHQILLRAIIGQQITVARARAHLGRHAALLHMASPTTHPEIFAGLTRLLPTLESVAEGLPVPGPHQMLDPARVLRLPRRSIGAVATASRSCATGAVSTDALTELPGVGPWTAAHVRMRPLPERDAGLVGDAALVAGAKNVGIRAQSLPTSLAHRDLARISQQWRPWRAYAVMRLWAAAHTAKE